jgi:LCP family protein required for cell wall assembly
MIEVKIEEKGNGIYKHSPIFKRTTHKIRFTLITLGVGIFSFLLVFFGCIYFSLAGSLTILNSDRIPSDPSEGKAINFLIIGMDSRTGDENKKLSDPYEDTAGNMNTDTNVLLHISADRSNISAVSIPRDSMINSPACDTDKGTVPPQEHVMFNSIFSSAYNLDQKEESGAKCVVKTLEQNTGLTITDYAIFDFKAFKNIIDELNGIKMYIPERIHSQNAGFLTLEKGCQSLDGTTALEYARARTGEGLGDGSDIERISRQQQLFSRVIQKVIKEKIFSDLIRLYKTTKILTENTDSTYSLIKWAGLAYSLRNVHEEDIHFTTVPFAADPTDPNRIVWTDLAKQVWKKISQDETISTLLPTVPVNTNDSPSETKTQESTDANSTDTNSTDSDTISPTDNTDTNSNEDTSKQNNPKVVDSTYCPVT